jgi:hypothetical protein
MSIWAEKKIHASSTNSINIFDLCINTILPPACLVAKMDGQVKYILHIYLLKGLDGVGSGQGQVARSCGYGEKLSSSINAGNFLTSCKVYC